VHKNIMSLIAILTLALIISCQRQTEEYLYFQVDMSKEHDSRRFLPELGDRLSIAGSFNDWKTDSLFLEDDEEDWIFSIQIPASDIAPDTIQFKFKLTTAKNRPVSNFGWESINNRIVDVSLLEENMRIYTFNQVYDSRSAVDIEFTVGMSNQMILGFFHPEMGDHIVVSGSFCDWSEDGFPLDDEDEDSIYTVLLPIKHTIGNPIRYKFKILSNRNVILPNSGWENLQYRVFTPGEEYFVAPYASFSDIRRVGRFVIDMGHFIADHKFRPLKGDVLQIITYLDGKSSLSNPLTQVSKNIWEISMVFPMTARRIEWQLVNNRTMNLTEVKQIAIPSTGTIIKSGPFKN
jgi:hypothetical protein